ncbi:SDR family NAD(P)-dependent oxidoreductase [Capnocytophaga sp. oral taxon 324]|uniref:SDR family NAD(P)-dependent oxidoreductase n=1 Tax=Capnocytophaga sp. oral taxon 324 TaxID=712211 RepID=UPI0002A43E79|nr:SDR family oxidoreductase [Capnocytophaga sp. oral taxon 324]EKY15521.1 oxidoreductase, short chain dehydrogenase/reductase family protein [Capnocytophaga sp. oral taxon 324 str. F0483]
MKNLNNKNAVITGGSDGIGLGIAKAFAREGANLLLIGKDPEKLQKAQQALLNEFGVQVHTLSADLSKTETVTEVVKDIERLLPTVDILVNNAGLGKFVPFEQVDNTLYDAHFNLNVKAPYFLTQGLLPALVKSKGNVINISSCFAHRMLPNRATTVYSATKGALDSFTKALAFEVGHLGVRVNAIAPGNIFTPQFNRNLQALTPEKQAAFETMVKEIYPLQHIGTPEDIAKACVFLASDNASWITGTVLVVDGGVTTN